jgi:hypothetical protein
MEDHGELRFREDGLQAYGHIRTAGVLGCAPHDVLDLDDDWPYLILEAKRGVRLRVNGRDSRRTTKRRNRRGEKRNVIWQEGLLAVASRHRSRQCTKQSAVIEMEHERDGVPSALDGRQRASKRRRCRVHEEVGAERSAKCIVTITAPHQRGFATGIAWTCVTRGAAGSICSLRPATGGIGVCVLRRGVQQLRGSAITYVDPRWRAAVRRIAGGSLRTARSRRELIGIPRRAPLFRPIARQYHGNGHPGHAGSIMPHPATFGYVSLPAGRATCRVNESARAESHRRNATGSGTVPSYRT